MGKKILAICKVAVMIAIVVLAVLGCLYVLEFFEEEATRKTVLKSMGVIGIITGATMLLCAIGCGAEAKGSSSE